jgi:DNA-binding CsgD family transcriptional regulator
MAEPENIAAVFQALTAKQREVLALVADNRTSKEIAGLLGISESAVNQRIEIVRARLGGLPRGELARLYRQEFAQPAADEPTWKKIHVPSDGTFGELARTESISSTTAAEPGSQSDDGGNGSQLSGLLYPGKTHWLARETRATAFVRGVIILAIVVAAIAVAVLVTQYLLINLD